MLELPRTLTPVPTRRSQEQRYQDASKETEGLELSAVDKLLVGIFVGCDGEGGEDKSLLLSRPSHLPLHC